MPRRRPLSIRVPPPHVQCPPRPNASERLKELLLADETLTSDQLVTLLRRDRCVMSRKSIEHLRSVVLSTLRVGRRIGVLPRDAYD